MIRTTILCRDTQLAAFRNFHFPSRDIRHNNRLTHAFLVVVGGWVVAGVFNVPSRASTASSQQPHGSPETVKRTFMRYGLVNSHSPLILVPEWDIDATNNSTLITRTFHVYIWTDGNVLYLEDCVLEIRRRWRRRMELIEGDEELLVGTKCQVFMATITNVYQQPKRH